VAKYLYPKTIIKSWLRPLDRLMDGQNFDSQNHACISRAQKTVSKPTLGPISLLLSRDQFAI